MAAIGGFNGISKPLPLVSVGDVTVTFDGHHAIADKVFVGSRFFDALKKEHLFDGRNWSFNGVPLPNAKVFPDCVIRYVRLKGEGKEIVAA